MRQYTNLDHEVMFIHRNRSPRMLLVARLIVCLTNICAAMTEEGIVLNQIYLIVTFLGAHSTRLHRAFRTNIYFGR